MNAMQTLVIPTDAPTVYGPPQGKWTAADWEQLPDDGNRYEIIEGHLFMSTSPSYFHQWIVRRLDYHIGVPAEEAGLAYCATAPIGVFMEGASPVQPDFVLVLAARAEIIRDRRIYGVPDLIIEVQSPGNAAYDENEKFEAYANAGVPEYVIVNPSNRALTHYRLTEPGHYEKVGVYGESDTVTFVCLPSISLHIGSLFAGAPDTTL
jgi:Uma2 family endonuclease